LTNNNDNNAINNTSSKDNSNSSSKGGKGGKGGKRGKGNKNNSNKGNKNNSVQENLLEMNPTIIKKSNEPQLSINTNVTESKEISGSNNVKIGDTDINTKAIPKQTTITKPTIIYPANPNLPTEAPPMAQPNQMPVAIAQLPPMASPPSSSSSSQLPQTSTNLFQNNQGELSDGARKLEQNKIKLENKKLELESLKLEVEKRRIYASMNPFVQCDFCNRPMNSCACLNNSNMGHYNNNYTRPYSTDNCSNNLYDVKIYKDTSVFKPIDQRKDSILCESGTYIPAATGRPPYDSIPKNDYGVF